MILFLSREVRVKSGSSHFDGLSLFLLALQWLLLFCLIPISAQADDSPVYRTIVRTFNNSNCYEKGLLLSEKMTDGSNRAFTKTTNTNTYTYTLKDVDSGNLLTGAAKQSVTATAFPQMTETVKRFFEGGSTSKTTFAYDDLGNVTTFTDFGDLGTDPSPGLFAANAIGRR